MAASMQDNELEDAALLPRPGSPDLPREVIGPTTPQQRRSAELLQDVPPFGSPRTKGGRGKNSSKPPVTNGGPVGAAAALRAAVRSSRSKSFSTRTMPGIITDRGKQLRQYSRDHPPLAQADAQQARLRPSDDDMDALSAEVAALGGTIFGHSSKPGASPASARRMKPPTDPSRYSDKLPRRKNRGTTASSSSKAPDTSSNGTTPTSPGLGRPSRPAQGSSNLESPYTSPVNRTGGAGSVAASRHLGISAGGGATTGHVPSYQRPTHSSSTRKSFKKKGGVRSRTLKGPLGSSLNSHAHHVHNAAQGSSGIAPPPASSKSSRVRTSGPTTQLAGDRRAGNRKHPAPVRAAGPAAAGARTEATEKASYTSRSAGNSGADQTVPLRLPTKQHRSPFASPTMPAAGLSLGSTGSTSSSGSGSSPLLVHNHSLGHLGSSSGSGAGSLMGPAGTPPGPSPGAAGITNQQTSGPLLTRSPRLAALGPPLRGLGQPRLHRRPAPGPPGAPSSSSEVRSPGGTLMSGADYPLPRGPRRQQQPALNVYAPTRPSASSTAGAGAGAGTGPSLLQSSPRDGPLLEGPSTTTLLSARKQRSRQSGSRHSSSSSSTASRVATTGAAAPTAAGTSSNGSVHHTRKPSSGSTMSTSGDGATLLQQQKQQPHLQLHPKPSDKRRRMREAGVPSVVLPPQSLGPPAVLQQQQKQRKAAAAAVATSGAGPSPGMSPQTAAGLGASLYRAPHRAAAAAAAGGSPKPKAALTSKPLQPSSAASSNATHHISGHVPTGHLTSSGGLGAPSPVVARHPTRARSKSSTLALPYTAAQTIAQFRRDLTPYEQSEILEFSDIWYWGSLAGQKKHKGMTTLSLNCGYDDTNGDYKFVPRDQIFYRFELQSILGKGSFGQVLAVFDHKTKQRKALKIIRNRSGFLHQAQVETKILRICNANDPNDEWNIVRMEEDFIFRRHLCIVFERLGDNLYEMIRARRFRGLDLRTVSLYASQILKALQFTRRLKIIHCDVKPENLLITDDRGVKLIDFGSSCFISRRVYTYIQSRFYRSPEVILGAGYDPSIDMWSFGCVLAELYTGQPIFPGEDEEEQIACIVEVMGLPDNAMLEQCAHQQRFFDSGFNLKKTKFKKHTRHPKPTETDSLALVKRCLGIDPQASVLGGDHAAQYAATFADFVHRCLAVNPKDRLTPDLAMQHPFIRRRRPVPSPRSSRSG